MRQLQIQAAEEGQRLDKYLSRYMPEAPKSFFYKMLRKKNITCNKKKCDGSEKLCAGDCIELFLAEDTIEKFRGNTDKKKLPVFRHRLKTYRSHQRALYMRMMIYC